jgi:hypothetical protein
MWKRLKILFKSIKDFIVSLGRNAYQNVKKASTVLGWKIVPVVSVSIYILAILPQLAVFAVIASFTSGIGDPILKFVAGLLVFAAMEYLLVMSVMYVVICLGIPEMLRFAAYIQQSYERRLAEEELRESEGKELTMNDIYDRAKQHDIPELIGV